MVMKKTRITPPAPKTLTCHVTLTIPPSINHSYRPGFGRGGKQTIIATEAARAWKHVASEELRAAGWKRGLLRGAAIQSCTMTIHLYSGAHDIDGVLKTVIDRIADYLDFNDGRISELHVYKVPCAVNDRCVRVTLNAVYRPMLH